MNLKKYYQKEIAPVLKKETGRKNLHALPKVVKVVAQVGFGKIKNEPKALEMVEGTLKRVTGQKPLLAKAKKSISDFKVRENEIIGAKVTLRGSRMYDFLEKLIKITLPRVRDFRGLSSKSLDEQGNLSLGFKEHISFPEIRSDEVERIHGLAVTVVTDARNRDEAFLLLKLLGFPFK